MPFPLAELKQDETYYFVAPLPENIGSKESSSVKGVYRIKLTCVSKPNKNSIAVSSNGLDWAVMDQEANQISDFKPNFASHNIFLLSLREVNNVKTVVGEWYRSLDEVKAAYF